LLVTQSAARLPVDRAAARVVLETLGVIDCSDAYPHQLSVGQQQRVAIARALVNRPRLVLADEPTSSLDDEACAAVTNLLLASIRDQGSTLVIATHDSRFKALVERQLVLPRTATGPLR
jgi:putative ABC transport system ATP-binding protein